MRLASRTWMPAAGVTICNWIGEFSLELTEDALEVAALAKVPVEIDAPIGAN